MKITVDTKSLVDAVNWVTKNYDSKNSTAYVALTVGVSGDIHLSHANPTSYMESPFQVLETDFTKDEVEEETVKLALEGNFLKRLAGALSGVSGPTELSYEKGSKTQELGVHTSNGKFAVPLLDLKVASEPKLIEIGEVDNREYFDSLQRLSKLCDPVNAGFHPILGAVDINLDADSGKITMMATDRYALSEISIGFDKTDETEAYITENDNVLLPVENAAMIAPAKGVAVATTLVYENKGKKFGYVFGDKKVALFSLKDAEKLAYKTLKDKAFKNVSNSISIDTNEFKKAISTVSGLAIDEEEIYFNITESSLEVFDSSKRNSVSVELESAELDKDYTVTFMRSIINKAFSPIATGKMNFKWGSAANTFVLEPVLEDGEVVDNVFVFVVAK